jgi:NADH dehydrogenase FAD-containing subunit
VTGFDLEARTVIAGNELEIPYDSLMVAAGATVDHRPAGS